MFKLVIQDDEGKTTVVPLIRDEITIGRKEGNTIRLTERNVSRRHARILRNNGEVHIEDLGSYNGIRVNNARIAERVSLRVSDQVQIGDYKLYLKAEGVEQVDDARTMPIERVDTNTSTDVIPAVAPAPTAPMPIPVTPSPAQAQPQLVGNPARTLVAIADTDPHGRPVASAEVIRTLQPPTGYGKLVVLSSNFAGKEFELSRPQMIIGRTDENDLVINHRSISRNHAKLVREPETGRYTVSDLQSSNGVRVNGQDYGKVELRRGDVVDLGHVRLRFVEPGEDFVFSRDAVITDVPDSSSKKGVVFGIVAAIVVLAAIGIVYVLKNGGSDGKEIVTPGSGTNTNIEIADAPQIATVTVDAPEQVTVPPPAIDAAAPTGPSAQEISDKRLACKAYLKKDSKKWQDAINCANALMSIDKPGGTEILERANSESHAEVAARNVLEAKDLKAAREEAQKIPSDSVYREDADKRINQLEKSATKELEALLRNDVEADKTCGRYKYRISSGAYPTDIVNAAKRVVQCKEVVVIKDPKDPKDPKNPKDPKDPKDPNNTPPKVPCDAAALSSAGQDEAGKGNHAAALVKFEQAAACGAGGMTVVFAYMAACNSRNERAAQKWFRQISPEKQGQYSQICIRNGIQIAP